MPYEDSSHCHLPPGANPSPDSLDRPRFVSGSTALTVDAQPDPEQGPAIRSYSAVSISGVVANSRVDCINATPTSAAPCFSEAAHKALQRSVRFPQGSPDWCRLGQRPECDKTGLSRIRPPPAA